MSKIDIDEFRAILGVGTLYPDETLQQVADASEQLIDSLLDYNRSYITDAQIASNVATFYTAGRHTFSIGSVLTCSGMDATFNGSRTVTSFGDFWFKTNLTGANTELIRYKPYGVAVLTSQSEIFDAIPSVREAALAIAVEIFQQRTAPGGQIQAVDFTPQPHRLGRALLTRVHGLLAPYMDAGSFIG